MPRALFSACLLEWCVESHYLENDVRNKVNRLMKENKESKKDNKKKPNSATNPIAIESSTALNSDNYNICNYYENDDEDYVLDRCYNNNNNNNESILWFEAVEKSLFKPCVHKIIFDMKRRFSDDTIGILAALEELNPENCKIISWVKA